MKSGLKVRKDIRKRYTSYQIIKGSPQNPKAISFEEMKNIVNKLVPDTEESVVYALTPLGIRNIKAYGKPFDDEFMDDYLEGRVRVVDEFDKYYQIIIHIKN